MDVPEKFRLDRTAVTVVGLAQRQNDRAYWLSRTPAERFEALSYYDRSPMATIRLPSDFNEFLRLFHSSGAKLPEPPHGMNSW